MTTQDLINKYGQPGVNNKVYKLPFYVRLSWDESVKTNKITLNSLVGDSFISACKDILDTYGLDFIEDMGLTIYGGSYNNRKMRGGDKLSTHAFSIAVDFDPENNNLKGTKKKFLDEKYKGVLDMFESNGWYNLGKYKGYDTMHFQHLHPNEY